MKKKIAAALSVAAIAISGSVVGTGSASASALIQCAPGFDKVCLYFYMGMDGAYFDQHHNSIPNYYGYTFDGYYDYSMHTGDGQGVKNNAASVQNQSNSGFTIFYDNNYTGVSQYFGPVSWGNLNDSVRNDNASGRFW